MLQTTLEQADTTQEEEAEPDVAMEMGAVAVETAEGVGEEAEEREGESVSREADKG